MLICFISLSPACHSYNPALYPSYDVLNPGPEVKANPLGWITVDPAMGAISVEWTSTAEPYKKDRLTVVNEAFTLWVYELKEEVKKLRAELAKK